MEPTIELLDALRREKIENARRMTFKQKFEAGAELFDYACRITLAGIRNENPGFTREQVMNELRRRIAIGERLDELRAEAGHDVA